MREETAEAVIGAGVLAVAIAFVGFTATRVAHADGGKTYELKARFDRVDGGLGVGSDVRLSGVKVGVVRSIDLDPKTYFAVVKFGIADGIEVPVDSVAKIASESLLGGTYLAIEPGGETKMLAVGGEIEYTRGSVDLLTLLAQMAGNNNASATSAPGPETQP